MFAALEEAGMPEKKEEVKAWYDGFVFGEHKDIYNPWSITKYLKEKEFGTYWVDTSSNALVNTLIQQGNVAIKEDMENLLAGENLITELDEQMVFEQLEDNETAIWSLLLSGGYLKVVKKSFDARTGDYIYEMAITNKEVYIMFRRMIRGWFKHPEARYNDFIKALMQGDIEAMNYYMNSVALATFSSFDTGNKVSERVEPERFYHGFVLGLMVDRRDDYVITSNRESGFGRYDVVMEPLNDSVPAIVMEFKVFNANREQSLEDTVRAAHKQMEEKQYDRALLEKGIAKERIHHYGFAFRGKQVLIG